MHHRHHLHFTSPEGSTFWPIFVFFLYIKAVHNLKTKSSRIVIQERRQVKNVVWTPSVSTEREPIMGVWGGAPNGSRDRALGQGLIGAKHLEAENFSAFGCPMEAANLPHFLHFANSLNPRYL